MFSLFARRPVRPCAVVRSSVSKIESLEERRLFAVNINIDAGHRLQKMDGFGTSLGGYTPTQLTTSEKFQKMYFQDLGASIVRVPFNFNVLHGPNNDLATPINLGPNINKNVRLFDFEQYNTKRVGEFVRSSTKYGMGKVKIIASLWSPPNWMKGEEVSNWTGEYTGKMPNLKKLGLSDATSGGSLKATDENLTQFGRYVAAFVKGYEQRFGVHIDALNVQNEPAFATWYSSAVYSPKLYVMAIKAVSRWFKKYGITTQLIGPEDVGVGKETSPSILTRQMRFIEAIRKDPEAYAAVSTWAIHGYADKNGTQANRAPEMWERYYKGWHPPTGIKWDGVRRDGKPIWQTEFSGEGQTWPSAIRVAQSIQDSITQAYASAWLNWGIAGSLKTYDGQSLTAGMDTKANKYSAVKHFSRFVRPGAVRLATNAEDPYGIYTSAYVHDEDHTFTTVLINGTEKTQKLRINVPGVKVSNFDIGYVTSESHEFVRLKNVPVVDGVARISLPGKSVVTLQGGIDVPPASVSGTYYKDRDADEKLDSVEVGLAGDKIFIDANDNGTRDRRELFAITDAKGYFKFENLVPGTYRFRRELPTGWEQTTDPLDLLLTPGQNKTDVLVGVRPKPAA